MVSASIPVWVLLAFAGWTLFTLFATVGVYRLSRIFTRRAAPKDFRADRVEGPEVYQRAMRAHANCVENLPVYAALVLVIVVTGVQSAVLDGLAMVLLAARIPHTVVHVALDQTNRIVLIRFLLFMIQYVCMVWMGLYVVLYA